MYSDVDYESLFMSKRLRPEVPEHKLLIEQYLAFFAHTGEYAELKRHYTELAAQSSVTLILPPEPNPDFQKALAADPTTVHGAPTPPKTVATQVELKPEVSEVTTTEVAEVKVKPKRKKKDPSPA